MLNKNLEATDAELAKVSLVQGSLQAEVQALEAKVQKTTMATKKVENTMLSALGEQMAVEKGTQNTAHATEKLRALVEEHDNADTQLHNELARIKVDTLNVTSQNTQLDAQLRSLNDELAEKEALMAKYEL